MTGRGMRALAALALASALLFSGCGKEEKTPAPPQEAYGIVDMETLVKAHPKYSEYFKMESEYQGLLSQYRGEEQRILRLSSARQKMMNAEGAAGADKAAEEEYKARVKIKEDSLNRQLENLFNEIEARHAGTAKKPVLKGDTSQDTATRIANLQLKLKVTGAKGEEKTAAQTELAELLSTRFAGRDMTDWTDAEKEELLAKRKSSEEELSQYAAKVASEIREKQAKRRELLMTAGLPDANVWNTEWSNRLKEKQKQMADVKAEIMKDIREKSAVIGQEKQLAMIFSSYRVNVNAVDVTSEIVAELVQIDKKDKKETGK